MESQENKKILASIENLKSTCGYVESERIACLMDSIDSSRSIELRANDIRNCVENDILHSYKNTSVESDIVYVVLITSSSLMKQLLREIGMTLETCDFEFLSPNIEVKLSGNLTLCVNIIETVITFLNSIKQYTPINITDVSSLPTGIASILLDVFLHCKNSESLYSTYLKQIGHRVTCVFKTCQELQNLYFIMFIDHTVFDLTQESHQRILLEALDIIVDIGDVVFTLDVKTMAEVWRGYSRICDKYTEWLQDKHIHRKAVTYLTKEIQKQLHFVLENQVQDQKTVTRSLKMTNFMLKLVIKLCEMFGESISRQSQSIIQLLSYIYQCCPPELRHCGYNKSIIDEINSHITVGCEPLLHAMIGYHPFRKSYFQHMSGFVDSENPLGDILLSVSSMKALLQAPDDIRDSWTSNNDHNENIVCLLLNYIKFCDRELLKDLKFDCNDFLGSSVSLYCHILYHCGGLSVACTDISLIEETLWTLVLSTDLWGALMALDLWIIIARYSSPTMRMEQLEYIFSIHQDVCIGGIIKQTVQHCYISYLVGNLFALLPNRHKLQLLERFPISQHSQVWAAIGLNQLPSEQSTYIENILVEANALMKNILSKGYVQKTEYNNLLKYLSVTSTISKEMYSNISPKLYNELTSVVYDAWQRLILSDRLCEILSDKECAVQGSHWINVFFMTLSNLTVNIVHMFTNQQLLIILQITSKFLSKTQSCNKLAALNLLKSITELDIKSDSNKNNIIHEIATLFGELMQNSNPVIRIQSLEVFSCVATSTPNESIVTDTVKRNGELRYKIVCFLEKKLKGDATKYNYQTNKFIHKCIGSTPRSTQSSEFDLGNIDELFEDSDNESVSSKKIKMDIQSNPIRNALDKLYEDVQSLSAYKSDISNNDQLKHKIKHICDILNELLVYE